VTRFRAPGSVPVVMVAGAFDAVREGLAASVARPGGNLTGTTAGPLDYWLKSMELFKQMVPGLTCLGNLWDAGQFGPYVRGLAIVEAIEAAARALAIEIVVQVVHDLDEIETAFAAVARTGVGGILPNGRLAMPPNLSRVAGLAIAFQ
jgi:ABC-type uncharacterized transport system substrate-binding protein